MCDNEFKNQIVTGDARELTKRIPDKSIDLIFTDPPYLKKYLYLYDWLAKESARILKPTGFVLTYSGGYWKDRVMSALGNYLEYFWDFAIIMRNGASIMWPKKVIARAKSILAYRLPGAAALPTTNVLGCWTNGNKDKRFHNWGQDEETARYYIDCFTNVGDLVLDPFVGGGTTCVVCEVLSRNFIAFEVDPVTADNARSRLGGFTPIHQPVLFIPEVEQLSMEIANG